MISLRLILCFCLTWLTSIVSAESLKRPSGLALIDNGKWLAVSLGRSGEIAMVQTASGETELQVLPEIHAVDVVAVSQTRIAVLNRNPNKANNTLVTIYEWDSFKRLLKQVRNIPNPNSEAGNQTYRWLTNSPIGNRIAVANERMEISFLPGEKTFLDDTCNSRPIHFASPTILVSTTAHRNALRLIFGDHLTETLHPTVAQNISGLSMIDDQTLVFTGQKISRLARTSFDDIHWGSLVSHQVRTVDIRKLQQVTQTPAKRQATLSVRKHLLGGTGNAAPDPHSVVTGPDQKIFISLSGSNQVLSINQKDNKQQKINVGQRPTSLLLHKDGRKLYVANSLDDTVSVIQTHTLKNERTIILNPQLELSESDQGERLFFSAALSHDNWLTCHTCHFEGKSNGALVDTVADGGYGTPKRTPDLRSIQATAPYAWNASKPDLKTQIHDTLKTTMHLPRSVKTEETTQLTTYLESLAEPKSDAKPPSEGRILFDQLKCNRCHKPPSYTSAKSYDVGIFDEAGNTEFNPPSLLNLKDRQYFFHDNRAKTLESVFTLHKHQLDGQKLNQDELASLIEFLRKL